MPTTIRLDPELERRIDVLAETTGRSKAFYLRKLIEDGIDDLEDYYLAADVLEKVRMGKEKIHSLADVRKALDLDS